MSSSLDKFRCPVNRPNGICQTYYMIAKIHFPLEYRISERAVSSLPSLTVFRGELVFLALSQLMNSSCDSTSKGKCIIGSEKETPFPVTNCPSFEQAQGKAQGRGFCLFFLIKENTDVTKLSLNLTFSSLFTTVIFILSFHPKLTNVKY